MDTDRDRVEEIRLRVAGLKRASQRVAALVFLAILPAVLLTWAVMLAASRDQLAVDFHHELYPQSTMVMDGVDPYPKPDDDLSDSTNTIWPIAAALAVSPLTLLPAAAADWAMTFLIVAMLAGALAVVGVRDWRVYGVVRLWPATFNAVQTANLTIPLGFLAAIAWREQRRWWATGAAVGVAVALKFFLWPRSSSRLAGSTMPSGALGLIDSRLRRCLRCQRCRQIDLEPRRPIRIDGVECFLL